jgi:hypothetical protein
MPDEDTGRSAGRGSATLEEFLAACQRSLARAAWNAQQVSKSDRGFAQGELPLYVVDGLDIELKAGFVLRGERERERRLIVDLDAAASECSTVRFRVESRPLEVEPGAKLEVAELNPLRALDEAAELCAWVQGPDRRALPEHEVRIYVAWPGDRVPRSQLSLGTDALGEVRFRLGRGRLDVVGGPSLPLSAQGGGFCWLWAESTIEDSEPPEHRWGARRTDGGHDWRSNTLRIRVPGEGEHGQ